MGGNLLQRRNCWCECRLGVITIVNKDVENSQSRNHVALLLWEFIHICVYRIFLDYVENAAVAWIYGQQVDV